MVVSYHRTEYSLALLINTSKTNKKELRLDVYNLPIGDPIAKKELGRKES